jgi:hypothetical protein
MLTVYNDVVSGIGGGGIGPIGPPGPGLVSETISLPDNVMTEIPIISCGTTGSYHILVNAVVADGATATFSCSKAQVAVDGQTERLTNSPAFTDERLKLVWRSGANKPALYHDPVRTGGVGVMIIYQVTYMMVF